MATYTLTSLKDTLAGSTLADNFNASYDAISGVDTFNSIDILDGREGIDTLTINHFQNVAITPPDALWSGLQNIEKVVIQTTGDGAQTITTGTAFEAAFAPTGINLTTTTTGAGAINLTMSSFTGIAKIAATSTAGAQTLVTGSGFTEVAALSGAGSLNIKGVGLTFVSAITTGAGAQTIGDGSGNGRNLIHVTAESGGGAQTITSTSANGSSIDATSEAGRQVIITGNGSDTIIAATSAELNIISTYSGDDKIIVRSTASGSYTLNGGSGNDSIYGGAGADYLIGEDGNDFLDGGAGADSMTGGNGNDTYSVRSADDTVTETNAVAATGGYDKVNSYLAAYILGNNIEQGQVMSTGAANLTGNSLNNVLYAGAGNNVLDGDLGSDYASYYFSTAAIQVSLATTALQATGGSGSDTLKNIENLAGSRYADALTGNADNNTLNGGAGADTLSGGDGSDTYYVDNAGDLVIETNSVASTGGIDYVYSYLSAYTLSANVENGRILSSGTASLSGNSLNNVLYAGMGNNIINGGAGTDTVSYAYGVPGTVGVRVSLATTTAQATGGSGSDTLLNVENLTGSNYADTLSGSTGSNYLNGGAGNDTLDGGAGNDTLDGGAGNDLLTGGLGADQLTGGTGADRFDFNALTEMGLTSTTWDTITDFKTSEGDKIDLLGVDANTALAGDQAFTFLGAVSAFTGDATGQLRFDAATHILYGSTDADTAAEFAIVLTGVNSLASTDLLL